jgi:hypothetical protein
MRWRRLRKSLRPWDRAKVAADRMQAGKGVVGKRSGAGFDNHCRANLAAGLTARDGIFTLGQNGRQTAIVVRLG